MINVDFADVRTVMSEMGMAMMGTGRATGENRAREAAEAAIRSPLLEDVNLQGARGILVNITAGIDLSLGEYSEVGSIIEEFASGDATVVVGTVIDPELTNELRVTVVATGLGAVEKMVAPVKETKPAPTKVVVDNTARRAAAPVDYTTLDRPAHLRANAHSSNAAALAAPLGDKELEYLDIPAFLRRQAD
jgi:cell division protein FtsZ